MTVVIIIYFYIIDLGSPCKAAHSYAYKDLVPSFRQPIPEVDLVEPLLERCYYENRAKKKQLKLWIAGYVNK